MFPDEISADGVLRAPLRESGIKFGRASAVVHSCYPAILLLSISIYISTIKVYREYVSRPSLHFHIDSQLTRILCRITLTRIASVTSIQ